MLSDIIFDKITSTYSDSSGLTTSGAAKRRNNYNLQNEPEFVYLTNPNSKEEAQTARSAEYTKSSIKAENELLQISSNNDDNHDTR